MRARRVWVILHGHDSAQGYGSLHGGLRELVAVETISLSGEIGITLSTGEIIENLSVSR